MNSKKRTIACCTAVLWFSVQVSAQQPAPPCQSRALKTVQDARLQAVRGNHDQAAKLLDQADAECPTSYAVLKGISAVYRQLGNPTLAELYDKNSGRYASQGTAGGGAGAAVEPAVEAKSFVRDKYALIVGVAKFQSRKIPELKYSAKDAQDFAAMLSDADAGRFHPENVTILTNEQATSKAIRSALAKIAARALDDDLVVLYFSTHGSSPSMDRSKIGSGYLVTYDTEVTDLYATAYGMDELANFMRQKIRAKRIVTFLDTCYSGDTTRILQQTSGSKALTVEALSDQAIGQIAQGKGSVVITSSNNRELSWESDERQNSFFTLYLIDAFRERHGLGSVKEIYTEIQRKIPSAVQSYTKSKGLGEGGNGASQNPVIYPTTNIPEIVIGTPIQ